MDFFPVPLQLSPINFKLTGKEADNNSVDAMQLGTSVAGNAKLYNQAYYLFFEGLVPKPHTKFDIRMQAVAFEKGSFVYGMYAVLLTGQFAAYPQLWGDLADLIVPDFIKAIIAKLTKRENKVAEIYREMFEKLQKETAEGRKHTETISQMHLSVILQSQDSFLHTIERIADVARKPAQDSVEPIGRTANKLIHFLGNVPSVEIDEPTAEAIRSKEELELIDEQVYRGKLTAVNKITGFCSIKLEGEERLIPAKITDPSLKFVGNLYTHAFDQDLAIEVKGKATVKDGLIKTIYITDAQ